MNQKMRTFHRYLGFFLAGIMTVYAISGIVLIFRDADLFKNITEETKVLDHDVAEDDLGEALDIKKLKVDKVEGDIVYFKDGTYDKSTRTAKIKVKELPYILDKMTTLHKAKSSNALAFLNIFFGVALLFFVVSAFWMYTPKTSIFKKGMYFVVAGLVFALVLLFV
jgi:uncharacterized iron-regulated membrane protein